MKTITTKDTWGEERSYEVVEKISSGFFVWNIGANMGHDEYIPLCEYLNREDYSIKPDTVKAIKLSVEEVKLLRNAAHVRINSLATAEKALKSKRRGGWSDIKRSNGKFSRLGRNAPPWGVLGRMATFQLMRQAKYWGGKRCLKN